MSTKSQLVGVIGPAGFGGSYLSVELIRRGHKVIGISRNPQSFGTHQSYTPRPVDIEVASIDDLAASFRDLQVLVSEYGPHTQGADALKYSKQAPTLTVRYSLTLYPVVPYVEVVRKLILAVKLAKVKYFVFVGGAGSLVVPGTHESLADYPSFFTAYRRQMAMSEAHVQYMEERLGPIGIPLRSYRNARLAQNSGKCTAEDIKTIQMYEESIQKNDRASEYIKAGRVTLLFFEGNTSFPWTFVSPSPLYRPGRRTGSYEVTVDYVPLKGEQQGENVLDGRLTGISAVDLAVAIVDEIEKPQLMHKHWTASADLSDDTSYPSYVTAKDI
jgi:putative NADH-flavin reductase